MFGREDAARLRHSPRALKLLAFPSRAESALRLILRFTTGQLVVLSNYAAPLETHHRQLRDFKKCC